MAKPIAKITGNEGAVDEDGDPIIQLMATNHHTSEIELRADAKSLVGNKKDEFGECDKIVPVAPLSINDDGELVIDMAAVLMQLSALNGAVATLQDRVTALEAEVDANAAAAEASDTMLDAVNDDQALSISQLKLDVAQLFGVNKTFLIAKFAGGGGLKATTTHKMNNQPVNFAISSQLVLASARLLMAGKATLSGSGRLKVNATKTP